MTTKPSGSGGRVNAALVHGKFTFLLGEICAPCGVVLMDTNQLRWCWTPNDLARGGAAPPYANELAATPSQHAARPAAMQGVRAQKSAAAIGGGAGCLGHRRAKHRNTRRSRATLAIISEPRPGEMGAACAHATSLDRRPLQHRAHAGGARARQPAPGVEAREVQ